MCTPRDKSVQTSAPLDYAPPLARGIATESREAARRTAQRAAALAGVLFLGAIVAGKTIARINGSYGDETFVLFLFLVALLSLGVWVVAFCIAHMPPSGGTSVVTRRAPNSRATCWSKSVVTRDAAVIDGTKPTSEGETAS